MSGGSDVTRVKFDGLTTGESNFSMAARAMQNELTDLEGKLRLHLAEWDSQAQQAYQTYQSQWHQAAMDMQNVVHQLAGAIGTANANYQAAERANTGIWT
jgi:WXG100 family type VII secretion target